jgi:glutathione S-transferase
MLAASPGSGAIFAPLPDAGRTRGGNAMAEAKLTISSKNYSSWSLRGWLLCRMAGIDFVEQVMPAE